MADKKQVEGMDSSEVIVAKAKDFWTRYSKQIMIGCAAFIIIAGGWYIYQNFFKTDKEAKAADAMFKAEEYYRMDSVNLALNGDGQYPGFLKVISQYGGTDQAKLAHFYAGVCYIKLNENDKAITHLKKAPRDSRPLLARTYKLMADAYGDLGKNAEAIDYYKKAAHEFEADAANSADALFMAAYLADRMMKNTAEATKLYKQLIDKFPDSRQAREAAMYLAQLGTYTSGN